MNLQTIEQGQRDWVNAINGNFNELGTLTAERIEEKDGLVLTNGWQKSQCYIEVLPLLNGVDLKICHLEISHSQLSPTSGATLLVVPDKASISVAEFIGGDLGDTGFYGQDSSHINVYYHPSDNAAHDHSINTTFMYF